MTDTPTKFCRDCRYVKRDILERIFGDYGLARCAHPSQPVHPVTGRRIQTMCSYERFPGYSCGPEGKNWEPKQ